MRYLLWLLLITILSGCVSGVNSYANRYTSEQDDFYRKKYSEHVGKQYWVSKNKPLNILKTPSNNDLGIETRGNVSFEVKSLIKGNYVTDWYYAILTSDNQNGFLPASDIEFKLESGRILRNDPKLKDIAYLQELETIGIKKGSHFWLKTPNPPFGGLEELVIIDIEVIEKQIALKVLSERTSEYIRYFNINNFIVNTSFKNPAPNWDNMTVDLIKKGKITIGMTREQVTYALGRPNKINESIGKWGTHEQWVYGHAYVYFENDIMSSLQQTK